MATAADPLRRTLDTSTVDPQAASDRPYLESVLRRLGYTDDEIHAYLAGKGLPSQAPAPGAPAAPVAEIAPPSEERDIEIEYTGPGLRSFTLVLGVDESELPALAAGMEAGTEVFESGPSMEEVDRLVAEGNFDDFGNDWGDGKPTEDAAGAGALEEVGNPFESGGNDAPVDTGTPSSESEIPGGIEFNTASTPVGGDEVPAVPELGADFQVGEGMVEFEESSLNEATVEVVNPDDEAAALREEGWQVDDGSGEFTGEAPTEETDTQAWESPDGFHHNDWTLYSKDEVRGDTPQRIFFFSRDAPEGGLPADVPEGYEVAENPETGRPFLRRVAESGSWEPEDIDQANPGVDPNAGGQASSQKKRVRIQRVRASSREEAMKKMAEEGRNVIASMPIDIENRLGDE